MTALAEEIEEAMAEGCQILPLQAPARIEADEEGKVAALWTRPQLIGRYGRDGRPAPGNAQAREFRIPCDYVIAAIGQKSDPSMLTEADGIALDRKSCIVVDEYQATSRPGVFAGGDGTTGPRTKGPSVLIHGMAQGSIGAQAIASYLEYDRPPFLARERISQLIRQAGLFGDDPVCGQEKKPRVRLNELTPAERDHNFKEAELGMSQEEAWQEAKRCMRCYRILSVVTRSPIPGFKA